MASSRPIRHIRPNQPFSEWAKQLVERRETLWFFVWKDLKVQYRQPILGLAWSVFQPLVYFGIIISVMSVAGRSNAELSIPFSLYLISGLTIWNFITSTVLGSINSIQSNAGIVSKAFFPRFYLVLSPIIKGLADLLIMLAIMFGVAASLGQPIDSVMLINLPLAALIACCTCLGWSAIAASLVVRMPQIRHAIPIVMYAMLFALPVFYDLRAIDSQPLTTAYNLNPIAGAMDLFRTGFGALPVLQFQVMAWLGQSLTWLIFGTLFFRSTERKLADLV